MPMIPEGPIDDETETGEDARPSLRAAIARAPLAVLAVSFVVGAIVGRLVF